MSDLEDELWLLAFPWLTRTGQSHKFRSLLEGAEAAHLTSAALFRALGREDQARRAEQSAAWVRLELDEPEMARRLYTVTKGLRAATKLGALLDQVLDGAMRLASSDRGNLQVFDAATGSLRIVAQHGFDAEFLGYFAVVDDDRSPCGKAATARAQAVIFDVSTDPDFAAHREVAAAAGFRSVESTPLTGHNGRLFGVVSTYYPHPHRRSERDLRIMRRFGELAGAIIDDHLAASPPGREGDRSFRAVVTLNHCQQGLPRARAMAKRTRQS
jgi:GAF domain-containing protein